ncbi:hypothetical protein B0H10DRAFT_2428415 [Mycena sp. CBHHK59/15]|nr:hypothetical protein B0H10DRAFT_2428415 [Mycena sp. CBHHK59/15]
MAPPDGFSKPRTKPTLKAPVPKFSSGFAPSPIKHQSRPSRVRVEDRSSRIVKSDVRNVAVKPKPVMRALKPPIPLYDSAPKSAVPVQRLPPLPIPHPSTPARRSPALYHLPPPPPPSVSIASSSKSTALKPLVAPPRPDSATDRTLRTISTTLIARATDLFTDNGTSELASIFLHDQHPNIQFPSTPEKFEEYRGIMVSPGKGKEKEMFVRNGLAARATTLYDRSHASLSLWEAEMAHFLSSTSSRRGLDPDMWLRIVRILHIPLPLPHPSSKCSIPGVALCHISTANPGLSGTSLYPRSKDELCAVLFSFSSISPPALRPQVQTQLHIRNPEDFVEGREVFVWKPWQILAIDAPAIQHCLEAETGSDLDGDVDMAEAEAFGLFEPGAAGAARRGKVAETALVCERFVVLK